MQAAFYGLARLASWSEWPRNRSRIGGVAALAPRSDPYALVNTTGTIIGFRTKELHYFETTQGCAFKATFSRKSIVDG
jgi:hypothetical protein